MSKRPFLPGVTLQALALGLHGQRTRNDASLHQAAALYGFAVRHLRLDLIDNTVAMISPRVVPLMESIFNLTLYEVSFFASFFLRLFCFLLCLST